MIKSLKMRKEYPSIYAKKRNKANHGNRITLYSLATGFSTIMIWKLISFEYKSSKSQR